MITFRFLGTSAGMPTKRRSTTSLVFRPDGVRYWIMVDCGEGTQHQLTRAGISPAKIEKIYITHLHGDHCLGLPGLLSTRSLLGTKTGMEITGPSGTRAFLEQAFSSTFTRPGFPITYCELAPSDESTSLQQPAPLLEAKAIFLAHSVPCFGYHFRQNFTVRKVCPEKLKNAGVPPGPDYSKIARGESIISPEGKILSASDFSEPPPDPLSFFIGGDNSDIERVSAVANGLQLLIHEATYIESDRADLTYADSHSSLEEIHDFSVKHKIPGTILTHFSPRYHTDSPSGLSSNYTDVLQVLKNQNIFLAKDFMSFRLSQHGLTTTESE